MKPRHGGDLLLLPSSLAAVALLALNDHVLKARFPGFWTGKLSDFSGLYFFPFFLLCAVVIVWPRAGSKRGLGLTCLVTAFVFSAINLSPTASAFYEHVVTNIWRLLGKASSVRHVADAEDLIALPMVALAYLVGSGRLTQYSLAARR